jgi:hypothetical protein
MFLEAISLSSFGIYLSDLLKSDLVKSLLSEKAKEWVKSPSAELKGKRAAFQLYQCLERVSFQTTEFVKALASLISIAETLDSRQMEPEFFGRCAQLNESLKDLLSELNGVDNLIRHNLGSALQIHRPEIIKAIAKVQFDRSRPLPFSDPVSELMESEKYKHEFTQVISESVPELKARLVAAQKSEREIRMAVEEFRQLLAKEFSFKESFV